MYIMSMIILIFFAIIGLCSFITALIDAAQGADGEEMLIILRNLTERDAEARVRRAARICMKNKDAKLICFCERGSPEERICEIMARDHPFITICGGDDMMCDL